jgi:hypothetical protein
MVIGARKVRTNNHKITFRIGPKQRITLLRVDF